MRAGNVIAAFFVILFLDSMQSANVKFAKGVLDANTNFHYIPCYHSCLYDR